MGGGGITLSDTPTWDMQKVTSAGEGAGTEKRSYLPSVMPLRAVTTPPSTHTHTLLPYAGWVFTEHALFCTWPHHLS